MPSSAERPRSPVLPRSLVVAAAVTSTLGCGDASSDDVGSDTTGVGGASTTASAVSGAASTGKGSGAATSNAASSTASGMVAACVKPDASNTGVPPGTVLEPRSGDMTITEDGTVVEGIDLDGSIAVEADDVVIRKSRVRRGITVGHYPDYVADDLLVEDCEIGTDDSHAGDQGVQDRNYTLRRVNVHNFQGGARAVTNVRIEHSWFHHPFTDPSTGHEGSGFFSWWPIGPGKLDFYCNNFDVSIPAEGGPPGLGNDAFEVLGNDGTAEEPPDLVIEQNWFNGGTYTVYILDHWKSVTARKNRWGRDVQYGPLDFEAIVSGETIWEENAYEDGEPIEP